MAVLATGWFSAETTSHSRALHFTMRDCKILKRAREVLGPEFDLDTPTKKQPQAEETPLTPASFAPMPAGTPSHEWTIGWNPYGGWIQQAAAFTRYVLAPSGRTWGTSPGVRSQAATSPDARDDRATERVGGGPPRSPGEIPRAPALCKRCSSRWTRRPPLWNPHRQPTPSCRSSRMCGVRGIPCSETPTTR